MGRHGEEKVRDRIARDEQSQAQERAMEQGRRGARHQICDALSPKSGDETSPPVVYVLPVIGPISDVHHAGPFFGTRRAMIERILSRGGQ